MPRVRRLDYEGARHHVINRGARRQHVFAVDGARPMFLELLSQLPARFGVSIQAYAIMGNHYHLMLRSPPGGIAPVMKRLDQVFTQRLNHRMGWDGPVFRGRYHDVVVGDSAHWNHLIAYLHGNPGRAGLPECMASPLWTSHCAFMSCGDTARWLDVDAHLARLGGPDAYATWLNDVLTGRIAPPDRFQPESYGGPGLEFRAPLTHLDPDPQVLIGQLEFVVGDGIPTGRSPSPTALIAAWWLRANGCPVRQSAEVFGVDPSTISRRVDRALHRAQTDDTMAGWMASLCGEDLRERASA